MKPDSDSLETMQQDEELRLIYDKLISDIEYSKKQIWNTLYLTILSLAGIISLHLSNLEILPSNSIDNLLILTSIIIGVVGIVLIGVYHWTIEKYRVKKNKVIETFTSKTKEILGIKHSSSSKWKNVICNCDTYTFILPFWILIFLSWFLTISIIPEWNSEKFNDSAIIDSTDTHIIQRHIEDSVTFFVKNTMLLFPNTYRPIEFTQIQPIIKGKENEGMTIGYTIHHTFGSRDTADHFDIHEWTFDCSYMPYTNSNTNSKMILCEISKANLVTEVDSAILYKTYKVNTAIKQMNDTKTDK